MRLINVIILSLFVSVLAAAQETVRPANPLEKFKSRPVAQKNALAPADSVFSQKEEWLGHRGGRVVGDVVRYAQDAKAYEKLSLAAAAAARLSFS